MTITIDKGIPVSPRPGRNGLAKYPWLDMAVGDSFFVAGIERGSFTGSVSAAQKRTGFKFTTRAVDGGVRVWRVE